MNKLESKDNGFGGWFRRVGKIVYALVVAVLVVTALVVVASALKMPSSYKLLTVQSGSMEPTIKKGAVVVVRSAGEYKEGDVITVAEPANPKVSLTHRIVEVEEQDGQISYVTKGDANETADTEERPQENVLGKVIFSLPYIGYPISFAKTQSGLVILIVIPATIIIYSEFLNIKKEGHRLLMEKKEKKISKEKEKGEVSVKAVEIKKEQKKIEKKVKK